MTARGMSATDTSANIHQTFRTALSAQTAFGVTPQMAGAFQRIGTPSGMGAVGSQGLAGVLQSAVAQGLRGSLVSEYLAALVDQGRKAEKQGIRINALDFTRQTTALTAMGAPGMQAARLAGGFRDYSQALAMGGVSDPMHMLLLRAAGFNPSQGVEGYARAMRRLQEEPGAIMPTAIGMTGREVSRTASALGGGTETAGFLMQRALGRMGMPMGFGMAGGILGNLQGGQMTPEAGARFEAMMAAGTQGGAAGRLQLGARALAARGAPIAVGAAGLEQMRVGVGERMAGVIQALERTGLQTANVLAQFKGELMAVISVMKDGVEFLGQALSAASSVFGVERKTYKRDPRPLGSIRRGTRK